MRMFPAFWLICFMAFACAILALDSIGVCSMEEEITIALPEEIKLALDNVMRKEGISPSDVIGSC